MSSNDVFPPRNLGAAEDWGRKVEGRTRSSEAQIESLSQKVEQLSKQLNALAGTALPGLSRVPDNAFQATSERGLGVSVAENWVTLQEHVIPISEDAAQVSINVSGTVQLVGTAPSNDAPWVRVSWELNGVPGWFLPDSQGVRSANNSASVFLATVSAATVVNLPPTPGRLATIRLQAWSSSATDFSSSGSSNLASLFTRVESFPEPLISSGS